MPDNKVRDLVAYINFVRKLKQYESTVKYKRPLNGIYEPEMLIFSDGIRLGERLRLAYFTDIIIGRFSRGSTYDPLPWSSHRSKRPEK